MEINLRLICRYPYHFSSSISLHEKWEETSYYTYVCRISVHYYETSYNTCRGTNVWPLIGSKFAKNN